MATAQARKHLQEPHGKVKRRSNKKKRMVNRMMHMTGRNLNGDGNGLWDFSLGGNSTSTKTTPEADEENNQQIKIERPIDDKSGACLLRGPRMGKRRTGRNRECPDHLLSVSPTYFQVRRGPCPDHFNPTQCPEGT